MTHLDVVQKGIGAAGIVAAAAVPSGQGYLIKEQFSFPSPHDYGVRGGVDVLEDPVAQRIREYFDPDSFTGSAGVLVTYPKTQVSRFESELTAPAAPVLTGVADMIAAVRSALSLQIKEIASLVGVERPTVYSWIQGKSTPFEQNRSRLQQLFAAARKWQALSPLPLGDGVRSVILDGDSLLDLLSHTPVPESKIQTLLMALASKVPTTKTPRSTAREVADRHGFDLSKIPSRPEQVDVITGKRTGEELG